MSSLTISSIAIAGLAAGLGGLCGCSGKVSHNAEPFPTSAGGSFAASTPGDAGTFSMGATGSGPVAGGAATFGPSMDGGGTGALDASGGAAPVPLPVCPNGGCDITKVVMSDGCNVQFFAGQSGVKRTIMTQGTKDPDCADQLNGKPACGAWSTPRDYHVYLPLSLYDASKPYSLIFEAPNCGGNGQDVIQLADAAKQNTIRVGLSPGPASVGQVTSDDEVCSADHFDDHEGNDSIDWPFYEALYDRLNQQLCFDRNRVFAIGSGSGAWFTNELGCKYAGDATRPVRGVLQQYGGLPTDPKYVPSCSNASLAGMWVHRSDNTTPFAVAKAAIEHAMSVDHCTLGDSYDTALFDNFPIGGGQPDTTCKRITGCDPLYPLVVCPVPGPSQNGDINIISPGFPVFVEMFQMPPLLTPQ